MSSTSRKLFQCRVASIEWFAEECRRVSGDVLQTVSPSNRPVVIKQPVGVVAAITPWNFPMSMITRKVSPAIAVGCPVSHSLELEVLMHIYSFYFVAAWYRSCMQTTLFLKGLTDSTQPLLSAAR